MQTGSFCIVLHDFAWLFESTFAFQFALERKIKVEVWDKDKIGSDDLIGTGEIDLVAHLDEVRRTGKVESEVHITRQDKKKGTVAAGTLAYTWFLENGMEET